MNSVSCVADLCSFVLVWLGWAIERVEPLNYAGIKLCYPAFSSS